MLGAIGSTGTQDTMTFVLLVFKCANEPSVANHRTLLAQSVFSLSEYILHALDILHIGSYPMNLTILLFTDSVSNRDISGDSGWCSTRRAYSSWQQR